MKIRAAIIVVKDWKERAFLRAELIEEGVRTFAVERMGEAEEWLADPEMLPIIIIYDTNNQDSPSRDLMRLSELITHIPVLIITSFLEKGASNLEELGFKHIIQRPIRIGDVVKYVKEILKGTKR
ncbi:MAG TPA: hypothetical protein VI935_00865 [Thermodesulfobacteriota bacterium]|nr:hypothetical protein [Thermodesulfobacteriota bacterium]